MKSNQKGFAHLGLILIAVFVLGAIGFAGYRIATKDTKNSQQQVNTQTTQQEQKEDTTPKEIAQDKAPVILRDAFDKCVIDGGKVTVNYDGGTPKERVCDGNKIPYIAFESAGLKRDDGVYNVSSVKLTELGSEPIKNCGVSSLKTKEVTLTFEVEGDNCETIRFYSKELQSANSWVACKADGISYNRGKGNQVSGANTHTGSSSTYLDNYNKALQNSKVKPLHIGDYYYIPVFGDGVSCLAKDASSDVVKYASKAYQNYQKAVESLR